MGYLKEFQAQILNRDFGKFLQLWEEYCTCDSIDFEEIVGILKAAKSSELAKPFGQYVEAFLSLWETAASEEESYFILSLIMDLQTTNSPKLANLAIDALKKRHGSDKDFQDKLRIAGLRTKENFQGSLANFDLLAHIKKGNYVFHASGFGAGEIMDFSNVREQLSIEFENVSGMKHITYTNAFKSLIPLKSDHFLAKRFCDPDAFEKEARENPLEVIKCLLRDLGPKNAAEIKDELCGLVIPEKEWTKWWQNGRIKIKKDTEIESPENIRDPFVLRKVAISHESQFLSSLEKKKSIKDLLLSCYNFIRDHSGKVKQGEAKDAIVALLEKILREDEATIPQKLQIYFCLESVQGAKYENEIKAIIRESEELDQLLDQIDIIAYKKLILIAIKNTLPEWPKSFLLLLKSSAQGLLRDYLLKELLQSDYRKLLENGLKELLENPAADPDFFVWYYHKLTHEKEEGLPFDDKEGESAFSESLLILLHRIENSPLMKDLTKKIYVMLTAKRYALIRQIFQGSTLEFVKEFLLLATKCHTITDHDLKIFRSLSEVVQPSLIDGTRQKKFHADHDRFTWTTQEGFFKMQERIRLIGTKEIVENAREIEAARSLGDLRENSEYKYACEKRSRLQGELKRLSDEFSHARVITPADIAPGEVGIGSQVVAKSPQGTAIAFTILGPWEADPDANILSFQSKAAMAMLGLKEGDVFQFKGEDYTISNVGSIFDGG
jgi:transcription elongation factor GreA-like protein/transcription elongation GreA/GreB family factor